MGIGSPARTMAINGAMLYGAGAALVLVFLLLPHPTEAGRLQIVVSGIIAALVTALLVVGRDWLPAWLFPMLTAAGTALISALSMGDGTHPSAFLLLYIWAAVYSFYFYPLSIAIFQSAWIAACSAFVLGLTTPGEFPLFRWLMITVTSVMAGLAVRQLVVQVGRLADHDAGTDVFSRRAYHIEIEREISRARRSGRPLSLVVLDLDNFKRLNDAHGHVRGDRHLRATAQLWQRQLRVNDFLARYGGEEFVAILPSASVHHAGVTADRLRASVPDGETASAGVAEWDGKEGATALFGRADAALYRAKAAGRNTTAVAPIDDLAAESRSPQPAT
ncbi:MAG: GGDEF domain-containing protein [Candidatus Dormibacteria bacterium]